MNKIKNLAIASLTFMAVGCGGVKLPTVPSLPVDEIKRLAAQGWTSPCLPDLVVAGRYSKETFALSESMQVNRSTTYFSDAACTVPAYSVTDSGTAEIALLPSVELEIEVEREFEHEQYGPIAHCEEGDLMSAEVAEALGLSVAEAAEAECHSEHWKIERTERRTVQLGSDMRGLSTLFSLTKLVVHDASELAALQTLVSGCGLSVTLDVGVEVSLSCDLDDDSRNIHSRSSGKRGYDVYKFVGDDLHFGDDSLSSESLSGSRSGGRRGRGRDQVENDRPTSVDLSRPYRKAESNDD
jgi:hypothetical protein